MKNFLKITSLFFTFIFLLSACEDFIEVEPIGPISDDYFNSEEEYEEALWWAEHFPDPGE